MQIILSDLVITSLRHDTPAGWLVERFMFHRPDMTRPRDVLLDINDQLRSDLNYILHDKKKAGAVPRCAVFGIIGQNSHLHILYSVRAVVRSILSYLSISD